ncbi:glycoside hydrolase family 13 protein [Solwaraspora sp. WMMB335]|uniref:glycoside hydrolase family 13 protein n=1 Tax=Solwaraspora sp. WMMB335 TaxID=3404118 RepID=UPI003B95B658
MSTADNERWWRNAVIYQIYPRSFADGDGDGIGDLTGIREHLPYLAGLGVDALWLSPWYPSPMADAGYDIADHRDIDPVFGTLAQAEELIGYAHRLGLRIIVDLVPNHCSDAHPWFQAALADPAAPERDLFWFRPGRGPDGAEQPTDWVSPFGGGTWTRTTDPDGSPGDWYLHLFAPQQPDFNWDHPRVRAEFADIIRFWLDRGVDGIRIDSAAMLAKDPTLPQVTDDGPHPFVDVDAVHDIYRDWRRIADSYPGDRALIGEIWLPDQQRFANYLRPDELHAAFNFDFLGCAWTAVALRACVDATLAAHAPVGAPATWVLSNHDVTRHVTRYGRADTTFSFATRREGVPTDLELGTRRARAAVLLSLALPGAAYLYQGEELGLWEVEDIPHALRQDPMFVRSGGADPGRDGCRVPLPWAGDAPPFGFSPDGATARPWLPQPADWKDRTVRAQTGDPHSMLELYRAALALRRTEPALGDGELAWLPAPDDVLAVRRAAGFTCLVNLSGGAVPLPEHTALLLASSPLDDDRLPPDTTVWLRTSD